MIEIKYDFYAENPVKCQDKDPFNNGVRLGSVSCQKCDHFVDMEKNKWVKCKVNAGRESESK